MSPSRISSRRSQWTASSMTWLEISSVAPSAASPANVRHRSARSTGSSPTVGSSSTSTSGRPSGAVASETLARPPERLSTSRSASSPD